ncbi:hypothetical protein PSEUBRA_006112 [Kalmanozyma brasiliensis GHG001]|uniref:uncharacterized protein n=1 Tax=Kalmanozyma brasiliensis (strain GHG001) TaxID=1365824 RepID=UPI001CEA1ED0|nr:uncharacterized protein PSEUBRA_006112 [Kalmanozyma brasiliensis GHG001]KAF6767617.1 hypothetical protein PSEUBRA_006112 [Kalmanozyma brasiliensis GHG001]
MSSSSSRVQPNADISASAVDVSASTPGADPGPAAPASASASRASGASKRASAAGKPAASKKARTSTGSRRPTTDSNRNLTFDSKNTLPYRVLDSTNTELLCICIHWIPDRRKDAKIMHTVWTKVLPGMLRIKGFAGVIVGDADKDDNPNNGFDGGPYYRLYFNGSDRVALEWEVQQAIDKFDGFAEDLMVFIPKSQIY